MIILSHYFHAPHDTATPRELQKHSCFVLFPIIVMLCRKIISSIICHLFICGWSWFKGMDTATNKVFLKWRLALCEDKIHHTRKYYGPFINPFPKTKTVQLKYISLNISNRDFTVFRHYFMRNAHFFIVHTVMHLLWKIIIQCICLRANNIQNKIVH